MSGESADLVSTLDLLCASKKLDRDKGEAKLREATLSDQDVKYLCEWISCKIDGLSQWEDVFGGLIAAKILLHDFSERDLRQYGLIDKLEEHILECLENEEFRARIVAGHVLGSLCGKLGLPAFNRFVKPVLDGITNNIERELPAPTEAEASLRELHLAKERDTVSLSGSTLSLMHDTAGWKHLETWVKCLQQMVTNLPPDDFEMTDRLEIRKLIFQANVHTNRYVRETGYDVMSSLIVGHGCYSDPDSPLVYYTEIASRVAIGLCDNWSQVRMAASRACRTFFEVDPPPGCSVTDAFPILLPPMCLNRHYVAEGVRTYSQETWCLVTKTKGRQLIGENLSAVLEFFFKQADSDNHAVREAACESIAEVASKLEAGLLLPHLTGILGCLVTCFGDESWPVRDAACNAIGTLVSAFPRQTQAAGYPDLMAKQLLHNLADAIPSVRDGAAFAIARILAAAKDESLKQLYSAHMESTLENLKNQASDSHGTEMSPTDTKGAPNVIVRRGAAAHDARHTNQVMYSCCSLGPKLKKGCHDGLHHRTNQPWECADGVVRLIGQLAEAAQDCLSDRVVEKMVAAAGHRHYTHYPYVLETACKSISMMCSHLDRARFKRHLEEFLVIIAAALSSRLPLAEAAGEDSLTLLTKVVGITVIRGRVEAHYDASVVRTLLPRLPEPMNR